MEKYEKLFKGLEMCAGPECSPECPYHGETRGGKTCRAWLLNDAAVALVGEMNRVDKRDGEVEDLNARLREKECLCSELAARLRDKGGAKPAQEAAEKPAPVALGTVEGVAKLFGKAEYWRGQADALKEFMGFYFSDGAVEDCDDAELLETEADDNV